MLTRLLPEVTMLELDKAFCGKIEELLVHIKTVSSEPDGLNKVMRLVSVLEDVVDRQKVILAISDELEIDSSHLIR
ncbi:hypothetical protein [Shewanella halifaxensis]|uniref:hypothetical protein n=1 Tax=Shewanella halifaxensis TaxID=271098 RepID=UPI000D595A20|nr:hypothetical protein [Shewanella halifaxensis]